MGTLLEDAAVEWVHRRAKFAGGIGPLAKRAEAYAKAQGISGVYRPHLGAMETGKKVPLLRHLEAIGGGDWRRRRA